MSCMPLRAAVAGLLIVALGCHKQSNPTLGDLVIPPPSVNGRLLPLAADTFFITYNGSSIGRGINSRSLTPDGKLLLVTEFDLEGGGKVVLDSLLSDYGSLRPLREARVFEADSTIETSYEDDSIRVATKARGVVSSYHAVPATEQIVFPNASLQLLVPAAPLAEGFEQQFTLHYVVAPPEMRGFRVVRMRVVRSATIRGSKGGVHDVWVVTAGQSTFWIDKSTRSIIRMQGRDGRSITVGTRETAQP